MKKMTYFDIKRGKVKSNSPPKRSKREEKRLEEESGTEKISKRELERLEEQIKKDKVKEQTKESNINILLLIISIILGFLITKMFF